MIKIYLAVVPVMWWMGAGGAVILTGIMDGTLTGGKPKAIELFIVGTENLGGYEIWRSQNGDPFGAGLGSKAVLSGTYSNTFVFLVKIHNTFPGSPLGVGIDIHFYNTV